MPPGRRLATFASAELADGLAPQVERGAPDAVVRSATVAGSRRVDAGHALVTVAATVVRGRAVSTRLVTVPIARDRAGGLVVYDLPSFAAAPARAVAGPAEAEPLSGPQAAAIVDVVSRFLRAYLAGDTGGLKYLVPPRVRIAAVAGRFALVGLVSVAAAGPTSPGRRVVVATARVRDVESRAVYAVRYRVGVVRRDRWYVAAINPPGARSERR
jgi:Conjugative transposon protein TcpC